MNLIPEKDWIKKIIELEKASKKSTKKRVEKALIEAVRKRIPKKKFGVLLSGGVDSCLIALLCQQAGAKFTCYTVGMKDSPDIPWAKAFAKQFKIPIKVLLLYSFIIIFHFSDFIFYNVYFYLKF